MGVSLAPEQPPGCFTPPSAQSGELESRLQGALLRGWACVSQTPFLPQEANFSLNYAGLEAHVSTEFSLLKEIKNRFFWYATSQQALTDTTVMD